MSACGRGWRGWGGRRRRGFRWPPKPRRRGPQTRQRRMLRLRRRQEQSRAGRVAVLDTVDRDQEPWRRPMQPRRRRKTPTVGGRHRARCGPMPSRPHREVRRVSGRPGRQQRPRRVLRRAQAGAACCTGGRVLRRSSGMSPGCRTVKLPAAAVECRGEPRRVRRPPWRRMGWRPRRAPRCGPRQRGPGSEGFRRRKRRRLRAKSRRPEPTLGPSLWRLLGPCRRIERQVDGGRGGLRRRRPRRRRPRGPGGRPGPYARRVRREPSGRCSHPARTTPSGHKSWQRRRRRGFCEGAAPSVAGQHGRESGRTGGRRRVPPAAARLSGGSAAGRVVLARVILWRASLAVAAVRRAKSLCPLPHLRRHPSRPFFVHPGSLRRHVLRPSFKQRRSIPPVPARRRERPAQARVARHGPVELFGRHFNPRQPDLRQPASCVAGDAGGEPREGGAGCSGLEEGAGRACIPAQCPSVSS